VLNSNLLFLILQGRLSLAGYNWWLYYDAFFFSRDTNPDFLSMLANFLAGAVGIYFVTPDPTMNNGVAAAVRILILFGTAVLIFRLAKDPPALLSPAWLLLTSHVGISLFIILGFCLLRNYWTAGKAYSYLAYLALLLLIGSVFRMGLSGRSWLNRLALTTAGVFLLLQFGFFFYRPVAARRPFGIHYTRPYPALADTGLKTTLNFADWSFLRHLQPRDNVAVHIEDPFIQSFVRMLLLSHGVKFYLEPPAFDRSSQSTVVPTGNCPNAGARLSLAKSIKGPFPYRLVLVRPVAAP
jgi:hypothetical protein